MMSQLHPTPTMVASESKETPSIMSGTMNWEPVRKRLLGPDLKDALQAATELREGIEIVHTVEFPLMLSALLPAFSNILAHRTTPNPDTSTDDHKLRNVVLEIICRMPSNEILRPHASHLVAVALDILNRDFEENALLASRIIFDLYKIYRTLPQDYVQPYLDFVQNAYRKLPTSVQRNFLFPALAADPSSEAQAKSNATLDFSAIMDDKYSPIKLPIATPTAKLKTPAKGKEESSGVSPARTGNLPGGSSTTGTPTATKPSPSISKLPTSPVARLSPRSNSSFRVLTECPLIVMLMFQLYPKFLRGNIPGLINVMMEALALRAPPIQSITQGNQLLDSNGKRLYFSRCRELVAAQAKTLSFLTYLLRGFSNDLKPYEDRLASNVVALMSTCPREFISTRKELLVATRHLLNSDFRNGFFRHVDALLDERVLMGSHHRYSEQTILRPLGYTTLSDLVHHVRSLLTMAQMSKVVSMFARVLHDSSTTLPISTQYTAVRTLLSIVDIVFHNKERDPQVGRDILVRILKTLVDKLGALKSYRINFKSDGAFDSEKTENKNSSNREKAVVKVTQLPLPPSSDPSESLRDLKSMIRAIIVGHKTLIWYINNYRVHRDKEKIDNAPPRIGANEEVASAMLKITRTEHALIDKFIVLAFPCMKCLKEEDPLKDKAGSRIPSTPDQYRDALTYFAAAFTTLDGYDLRRTLGRRLDLLVDAIMEDSIAIVIPRHLLAANSTTSLEFCTMLLDFLVERIDKLAVTRPKDVFFVPAAVASGLTEIERLEEFSRNMDTASEEDDKEAKQRSTAYLQLFERVLKSLSTFPGNERALRPHLKRIVATCVASSMEKSEFKMDNHCMLLRYIFRSISAGKFEESYKELLPLIPTVLNGLFRVLTSTDDEVLGNIIIELLLTIPARLSSLLPHMNLLLRVITRALESISGDLVNLGLRTLEFWVDNLNPEFLFPELSKQSNLFVRLMKALSTHLRPAPYPYGLLTLRLLGKLGGKNRRVLRYPINISDPGIIKEHMQHLGIDCAWSRLESTVDQSSSMEVDGDVTKTFPIRIPIEECVQILKRIALCPNVEATKELRETEDGSKRPVAWKESRRLWNVDFQKTDFFPFCVEVIDETKRSQVDAAMTVLRGALTKMVALEKFNIEDVNINGETDTIEDGGDRVVGGSFDMQSSSSTLSAYNKDLELVGLGLMFGCAVTAIQKEALAYTRGLLTNLFLIVLSHQKYFVRVDANGSSLLRERKGDFDSGDGSEQGPGDELVEEVMGSLKPFGYFEQTGPLRHTTNPMRLNNSLAEFLSQANPQSKDVGLGLLTHLLSLPQEFCQERNSKEEKGQTFELDRGSTLFFENLLRVLIEKCVSVDWNRREGLCSGINLMVETLGSDWARKYESEILYAALFSLKSTPGEMAVAAVKGFQFLIRVCSGLYGSPAYGVGEESNFVFDSISSPDSNEKRTSEEPAKVPKPASSPCDDVLQTVITEMASTNQIVRIAARYIMKHYIVGTMSADSSLDLFRRSLPLIKRVIFSRSLRLLPLPEQIGVVEALTMIVQQVPKLFPLDDQHLLAFLSELLKMSSVADGEMSDTNLSGEMIDKNGLAVSMQARQGSSKDSDLSATALPSSALFQRRECIIAVNRKKIVVPEESPRGVQLRVSIICLLRFVIRAHANPFFDAETSTPVGNIRPHVISLLFRSLVSRPLKAVSVAHDALRDVLSLSVVSAEGTDGAKSKSRLRKELLQTCIRPVLLNLRDYTRLSPHLLRGLSRLLSLLSSWFNKTLGEKLLDHLQKWTDPNRMKAQKIWPEGEEPDVAAAIVDLFVLLPHAAHFVEPLVKTTIKLEACLPAFKSRHVLSPYRKPLARYLNKHCPYTVPFFFQRLKTPLYSELFQDLIKLDESKPLREYLSGRQCSVSLLNICFERPLAIIRSEKATPGGGMSPPGMNTTELLFLHGIEPSSTPPSQREVALRRDIEARNKKLVVLQQEFKRAQEFVQAKIAANTEGNPSSKAVLDDAKRKHQIAKLAYERGAKEFKEVKQRYTSEMAKIKSSKTKSEKDSKKGTARPMNTEALELQHQGFRVVETLMKNDDSYLKDHNDVLRAFRWLWRSKGRYLRLQHERSVPPRYHGESKLLATFLVNYSGNFPNDVDLLFELIRIFLQSSASDFSFVGTFLADAVSNEMPVDQKKQIMQRFFVLLAGESTEEIKTLSIQLVVYPMLEASFKKRGQSGGESSGGPSQEANVKSADVVMGGNFDFIGEPEIKKFVHEALFHNGRLIVCGDRLKVELLRLSNLFLEFVPNHVEKYGKDLIRFCWALLKSDDASCKSWAYLVVCRFASVLDTPSKIILQVYVALLRSHQQEGKDLVREALDLLVPALPETLKPTELKKMVDSTNRIMFEEGNSVPQLAHIWHTITKHPQVFYSHRNQFVRYMINSLNRLGLPPNCPPENRILSVSIVELVTEWDAKQGATYSDAVAENVNGSKRHVEKWSGFPPEKKRKISSGSFSIPQEAALESALLLDQSMVDTIANFTLRLKILLADPKVETGAPDIDCRLGKLFKSIAAKWKRCALRPVYLEKAVSMCKEENALRTNPATGEDKARTRQTTKSKASKAGSAGAKSEDSKKVTSSLLSACLDIFIVLVEEAPENSFLMKNPFQLNEILASCFFRAQQPEEIEIRAKLHQFVVMYMSCESKNARRNALVLRLINVQLENFVVDAEIGYRTILSGTHLSTEDSRQNSNRLRQATSESERPEATTASFALHMIQEVSSNQEGFFKTFSSSLLSLLGTLVKKHIADASAKQKQGGAPYAPQVGTMSIRQMHHTPTGGILCESIIMDNAKATSTGPRSAQVKEPYPAMELKDFDKTLRSAAVITEMLGSSDLPYTFTRNREMLFQILGNILDSSSNLQLLLTAVRVIGRWLLCDLSAGPLTAKERDSFLWRICSFDFNGLPDAIAQPLADLLAHYIIAFSSRRGLSVKGEGITTPPTLEHSSCKSMSLRVKETDEIIVGRSIVACLLSANRPLRKTMLRLFVLQTKNNEDEFSTGLAGVPLRSPAEVLWQLLHSDFEGLGGRCWIAVFVELLLTMVRSGDLMESPEGSATENGMHRVLPLPRLSRTNSGKLLDGPLLADYRMFAKQFLEEKYDVLNGAKGYLEALQQLAHGDVTICQTLFQTLLPAAWSAVPNDGIRLELVSAMESLLSQPFHCQFFKNSGKEKDQRAMNAIRSFLNGVSALSPLPSLDIDLLVSLAETYNCWYEVLSILEDQLSVVSNTKLSTLGIAFRDKTILAMRHCYRQLGESNVWMSLALKSCELPETKRAASLDVYGRVDEALEAYSNLVDLVESGASSPPDMEKQLWEERWVDINREQCQLSAVSEYAKVSGKSLLMLECAWKRQDWDRVRALCSTSPLVAAVESGEPAVKMSETLLAVADGKLSDVENLHAQTAQLCLYKWQQLPALTSGSNAHAALLHFFHRLVEIRESGQIMVETSNHSTGKTLPDLKNLLNAWRHRLPNDYEDLTMWDEVFTWRSHMFTAITSNFHWSEPSTLATLHDRPWTAIRMSMTARKQGMRQTSLLLLNKLTDNRAMDVSDVYLKLREQILSFNNPESDLERTGGLNLINTTNLSYFDKTQKSELFRLKAIFLASLRRTSKSNQAYCHSVQICPTHAKSWISWGGLCSSLGTLTERQTEQMAKKSGSSEKSKEARAASAKKVAQYLAQAMGCYMEAVQINSDDKSRIHLPKCLWMLTKDGSSPGVLCQTLENRGTQLPPWVWLPWIPQLLTGLCRIEGRAIKAILGLLVKAYPQAVYYSLRAFYLERRDVERAKGVPSSGQHMASVAHAEEMMSTLRRSHASLWSSLEAILEELIVKFRPSYEEELLATISALLERAESHAEKQCLSDKERTEDEDAMVASWSKTLSRIAAKFFRTPDSSPGSQRRDERVRKTEEFKEKYKLDFENDFKVDAAGKSDSFEADDKPHFSLEEYITKLQLWKRRLEAQVACTPTSLPLIESSPSLAMFAGDVPDLWPGACDTKYVNSSSSSRQPSEEGGNGRNQSSASSSAAIARRAALTAAIAAAAAAAKEGLGGEYGGGSACIEIPGQYCPNSSASADTKPSPELHSKLMKFEPDVEVLRRNDQLVRRVGMVGSDGRTYKFLLQFAIPYWTRTDERTAQTHYVIDQFLRQNITSARNHLSVQPSAAIPVAQRLRMTLDVDSRIALDDVLRENLERKNKIVAAIPTAFLEHVSQGFKDRITPEMPPEEKKMMEKAVRLEAYHLICNSSIESSVLRRHIQAVLDGPESFFHFRRAVAGQLAANSLLQYVFAVAERTPQRFVILQRNGRVLSPDFRVSYTNQGFIDNLEIPFRMTPNIESLIGGGYLEGRFIKGIGMIASAISEHRDEFDPILRLLMRDDILAWYSKSQARIDSKTQDLERQLIDRVTKNVGTLQSRIAECSPSEKMESKEPIDVRVQHLCDAAMDPDKLCMMPTNYHAWL